MDSPVKNVERASGFSNASIGESSSGGVIALVFWCVYFLPIGVLSYFHFGEAK